MRKSIIHIFCFALAVLCIAPFIIMFFNATKSAYELNIAGLNWLPGLNNSFLTSLIPSTSLGSNWGHLVRADVVGLSIFRAFLNSLIVATCSTTLSVYISSLTAFGFTAYRFKGNKLLYTFVIVVLMVPANVSIVAFYDLMLMFGWAGVASWKSFLPLILPAVAAPSTVFFMRQYMKTALSLEMVEAGRIDGCTEFGIFNRLVLPIIKPGMATMAIFAMVASWNNLFLPMVLLRNEWRTIPVYVSLLSGSRHHIETGAIFLGLSLTAIPLLAFYLTLSKFIIAGVSLGSIKE